MDAQELLALQALVDRLRAGECVRLTELRAIRPGSHHRYFQPYRDFLCAVVPGTQQVRAGKEIVFQPPSELVGVDPAALQAIGLGFAVDALRALAGAPWFEALERLRDTADLRARRGPAVAEDLRRGFRVVPAGSAVSPRPGVVATLSEAWQRRRLVRLTYASPRAGSRLREVAPWGMFLRGDHAFLVAGEKRAEGLAKRHLRLDRIESAEALPTRFQRPGPRTFDPDGFLDAAWGVFDVTAPPETVRVQVREHWVDLLQHFRVHRSQQTGPLSGGWLEVSWQVRPCPELESFLLSMAPDVRILAPSDLRDRVARRHREGLEALESPAQ